VLKLIKCIYKDKCIFINQNEIYFCFKETPSDYYVLNYSPQTYNAYSKKQFIDV
jgi:hypothetical protein